MHLLWLSQKNGEHPLLPFIALIIGMAPLAVAKRVDDLGCGRMKTPLEYFRLFHDPPFRAQWIDEMNHINLPMSENSKLVLFRSAKSVVPVISLVPTTSFFYKLVKNWEDHSEGIITMPGLQKVFFQADVSDIGHDSPPQRSDDQPTSEDQPDSPNTEQDTIVDIPQSTFSTDQDTTSAHSTQPLISLP